jgi:hypothetical protein
MHHRRLLGPLVAGFLLLGLALAPLAGAARVSIRIEGQSTTLVPRTTVKTPSGALHTDGSCPGETLAGAIEKATAGNWDKAPGGFSNTIRGETHDFSNNDYWAGWVNNKYANGFCDQPVQDGDDLLVLVDTTDNATFASAVFPLELVGLPSVVKPGQAVTVTARQYRNYVGRPGSGVPGVGDPQPLGGVRISGGRKAVTTAKDGTATVTFTGAGAVTVSAFRPVSGPNGSSFSMRSALRTVCVDDGAGACGDNQPPPAYQAPDPDILGIVRNKHYAAGKAPRELHGRVVLGSAELVSVRLRLRRAFKGDCSYYSDRKEAFRSAGCGVARWFKLGDRADFSYLLPERLPAGRYELDVRVADRAGQKRIESIVFHVRKRPRS